MLDIQIIRDAQAEFDCSADFLCAVAGISSTKLSRHLNQIQTMPGPDLANLLSVIGELRGLLGDARPLPLAFKNARVISGLLEKRGAGLRIVPVLVGPNEVVEQIELEMATTNK